MDAKILKLDWPLPDTFEALTTNIEVLFAELLRTSYYGENGFSERGGRSNASIENKELFYKEQAEKFKDYVSKFRERDILSLFEEWSDNKGFADEDAEAIFKVFIEGYPQKKRLLTPKMNISLRDDPIALRDVVKLVLLAIELGDKDKLS